jgi:hypothetical protein
MASPYLSSTQTPRYKRIALRSFCLSLWACRAWKESHSLLLSVPIERYHKR